MLKFIESLTLILLLAISVFTNTVLAHSGHINQAAWDVCEDRQVSMSCEYADREKNIYRGTCQLMSEHRICVRNEPIEKAN
jgi:hypothetical protein